MTQPTFAILITTKNRLEDLKITLAYTASLLKRNDVECVVCDDGSNDGTNQFIQKNYPEIKLVTQQKSKGYLYSRNYMLNTTLATYAISLDDDAHFFSENVLDEISTYFNNNKKCAVLAFRIFWSIKPPISITSKDKAQQVKGFVGCGHVWRMDAWRSIPNYPEWFQFYGEEQFASLQLSKHNWQVLYVPSILVQHRVDMKARKDDKDYVERQRRSLRSGWYLYFMCYPKRIMFRKFFASIWSQLIRKTFKGNFKATKALFLALFDLIIHIPIIAKGNYRLTKLEYQEFVKLPDVKVYWKPDEEST